MEELHTGQLFFAETITTRVAALAAYAANTLPRTPLAQDGIYDDGGAASGLLTLTALGSTTSAGYAGALTLGVDSWPEPHGAGVRPRPASTPGTA